MNRIIMANWIFYVACIFTLSSMIGFLVCYSFGNKITLSYSDRLSDSWRIDGNAASTSNKVCGKFIRVKFDIGLNVVVGLVALAILFRHRLGITYFMNLVVLIGCYCWRWLSGCAGIYAR